MPIGGILCLTLVLSGIPAGGASEVDRLRARLALVREGVLFLELREDALSLQAAGWEVKRIPATSLGWGKRRPIGVSRVKDLQSARPIPETVMDSSRLAEAEDVTASVSTLDQIIGVEEMPDTFLVRFEEGGLWLVEPGGWVGPRQWLGDRLLSWKVLGYLLGALIRGERLEVLFVTTDRESARRIFWILRHSDLPVIR
jgi:hypothetical protein